MTRPIGSVSGTERAARSARRVGAVGLAGTFLLLGAVASADTLLYWTIPPSTVGSAGNTNGVAPANGDGVVGISGTQITLLGSSSSGGTTSSDGWRWYDPSPRAASLEEALTQSNFFEWSVTTNGATTATINGLGSTSFRKGSSAPNTLGFLYSTDPSWATYRTISAATSIPGSTATDLAAGLAGDLSSNAITLAAGSTGYFRLAYWGATSVSSGAIWMGDAADGNDFSLLGTVASSTRTLTWNGVAGPPGSTWDTSPANTVWLEGASATGFNAFDDAVFPAATDVVVDAGGVSAGGVQVTNESGSVAIGGGSITASSLTKTGAGTLVLAVDNTFNTGVTVSGGTVQIDSAGALGAVAASFAGGTLMPAVGVATVANNLQLGSGGLTVDNAGTTTLSGGVTASVALDETRFVKTGAGTLVIAGDFGVQNTGQLELDISAGAVSFQGSQKNIGGASDWNGDVTLDGALMMLHGGTVSGTGTITNTNAGSILESRFNRGQVRVENALVLDESITIDSPNGDNLLQLAGDISGTGGLSAIGNGPKELLGSNSYSGTTTIGENGTLTFGQRSSLYGGNTASWTDTNLVVGGTGGAGFRVGGSGQFTAADLDVILPLGTATGGFLAGARTELDTSDGDFAYASGIGDPNAGANQRLLVKQGANTLSLSGTNTYTGSTTIEAGTLTFTKPAALYGGNTGSWTAANLVVEGNATAGFGVGGAEGFSEANIDQLAALTGFANNSRIGLDTTDSGGSFTYSSVLADPVPGSQAIGLVKLGTGTLVLSGANTYTGGTIVAGGTLQLGNAAAVGTGGVTVDGGSLDLAGFSLAAGDFSGTGGTITNSAASAAALSVTVASGTSSFSGAIADGVGAISLAKTGGGDLRLTGTNTYSGGTQTDGDIRIEQAGGLGSGPIASTGGGGRVYWEGVADSVTFSNALQTGTDITMALAFVPGADRTVVLSGPISGSGQIKISSSTSGVLDLTGQTALTNTNVGGVEIGSGRVLIDAGENLGAGNVNFGTSADSTLLIGGADVVVTNPITLGGTTSTSAGTAIIDTNGNALTLSGGIDERTGNLPGSLQKVGLGTLTLSGTGAFQGTTVISAGTLVVAAADALQSTAGVTVDAGATLAGTGTVGAATAVAGIVAPGASIGTLTMAGDLTWSGAATGGSATDWLFELGPGNTADLLDITGGSFLRDDATGSVYRFDFGGATDEGTYTLVNWSGATDFTAGDFSYTNLGGGLTGSFSIAGSSLSFSAVPEPSTFVAAAAAAGCLGAFWRRSIRRRGRTG
jgi:fibronectin-binding autotransporter adhesin